MVEIMGLKGLRPNREHIEAFTCPPYDVIKPGTKLEGFLRANGESLYHITLGGDPCTTLQKFIREKVLMYDDEPCFYVYEQLFNGKMRTGVLAAVEVSDYSEGKIIRHEKTFAEKVKGRLELSNKTGYTFEPVFLLTKSEINRVLERVKTTYQPEYQFVSDFAGASELHGISNRIFRLKADSEEGKLIRQKIGENPLYIADGHHRYHAALLNHQTHCLAYICEKAEIQAYNRVINGQIKFAAIKDRLALEEIAEFKTPPKHHFAIYSQAGTYLLPARHVPEDVVGRLDCSILEAELYPVLGLTHEMITDARHFDYYPEADLGKMKQVVDAGEYDIAVALHPVSLEELMAVADAGLDNPNIVMPEKSTFFSPKILSGIFIYQHAVR